MRRFTFTLVLGAAVITTVGCDSGDSAPRPTTTLKTRAPAAAEAEPQVEEPAEPEVMVRKKATIGVGKKGRDYKPGLVSTPVKAFFTAKEEIAYNIEIPHALQLYQALNDASPKSHEEFMEKIIQANRIELPELPSGHHYVYDPDTAQLMVEHPR